MTTAPNLTHLPPLGGRERDTIGDELQATLVDLLDLSLVGKQLHWSVFGPLFRPLHLQLDELVDSWHDLSDTVAERAVAIGYFPDGQADAIAKASEATKIEVGPIDDQAVLRQLVHRLAESSERIRTRMDRLGDLDLASQDVLIGVVRELEKQLWMIRSQTP